MQDTRENQNVPEAERTASEAGGPQTPQLGPTLEFPEDKINGEGYMQYNRQTGWFWIGLKVPKFTWRTAWAFIKSSEYQLSTAFDEIEQARIRGMQLIGKNGKPNGPLQTVLRNLNLRK